MRRGIASLVVLLVILISALFLLSRVGHNYQFTRPTAQASPSPDPFADWKTFKDQTYKFSLRYPKEWYLRRYDDLSVDFLDQDPRVATPGAIKLRYRALKEQTDLQEFERVYRTNDGATIYEPLDVRSIITKTKNSTISLFRSLEYTVDRTFSALEGPRKEFSHVIEINKEGTILKFQTSAETQDLLNRLDPTFTRIISSIKF